MKIYFKADEGETVTDFRVAEAVVIFCKEGWRLNAEVVAKMILLEKEGEGTE